MLLRKHSSKNFYYYDFSFKNLNNIYELNDIRNTKCIFCYRSIRLNLYILSLNSNLGIHNKFPSAGHYAGAGTVEIFTLQYFIVIFTIKIILIFAGEFSFFTLLIIVIIGLWLSAQKNFLEIAYIS